MQSALPPLRTACNAHNAYNSTLAIASILGGGLRGTSGFDLRPRQFTDERTCAARREHKHRRHISTARVKDQQAREFAYEDAVQEALRQDAETSEIRDATDGAKPPHKPRNSLPQELLHDNEPHLGLGGTFVNLMTLRERVSQQQSAAKETDAPSLPITHQSGNSPRRIQSLSSRPLKRFSDQQESMPSDNIASSPRITEITSLEGQRNESPTNMHSRPAKRIGRKAWQKRMGSISDLAQKLSENQTWLSNPDLIKKHTQALDYEGMYVEATPTPLAQSLPLPWTSGLEELSGKQDWRETLGTEIRSFVEHMSMTRAERAARDAVISHLLELIATHYGSEVRAELFGSEKTGLALPTSDIDIRLVVDSRKDAKRTAPSMIKLMNRLQQSPDYILAVFRHAKLPIINVQHKATGIDIQIVAAPSTSPQEATVLRYLKEDPSIVPLYVVLKTALSMRGLTEPFYGGTGSYGLFVMIAASLKRKRKNIPHTVRSKLYQVLRACGDFDTNNYGLSLSAARPFKKHSADEHPLAQHSAAAQRRGDPVRAGQWAICRRNPTQPYLLCLQDPSQPTNDLGRKAHAIKHVLTTFRQLKIEMSRRETEVARKVAEALAKGERAPVPSVLQCLVGLVHEVQYDQRRRLEEYGTRVLNERGRKVEVVDSAHAPSFIGRKRTIRRVKMAEDG